MHCLQVRGPYEMEEKIRVRLPNIYKIRKIGIVQPHKKSVPMAAYHSAGKIFSYSIWYFGYEKYRWCRKCEDKLRNWLKNY